jgi:hypothetical protein
MAQDFLDPIPIPRVISTASTKLTDILALLKKHDSVPRIVLNPSPIYYKSVAGKKQEEDLVKWAGRSTGVFGSKSFDDQMAATSRLRPPGSRPPGSDKLVTDSYRLCAKILVRPRGNRSCFDKCK